MGSKWNFGEYFLIQISSATKLKGHLMKNKRCRWGLCISEKQGRTSLQAILANSASSQPCPTTNTSIITNLKTTTTNLTNITIPLYYHHHPSHLPFRLSANNYQRHRRQILTSNMCISIMHQNRSTGPKPWFKKSKWLWWLWSLSHVSCHVPVQKGPQVQVALILWTLQLFHANDDFFKQKSFYLQDSNLWQLLFPFAFPRNGMCLWHKQQIKTWDKNFINNSKSSQL